MVISMTLADVNKFFRLGHSCSLLGLFLCLHIPNPISGTEYDPVAEALDYVEQIARQKNNCSFGPSLNLNYDKIRWTAEAEVAVRAANLLSTLFRAGYHMRGIHEADTDLLYAIVLSNVENNENVFGSAIAFVKFHYRDYEIYCPYAFRAPDGITAKDLSIGYDYHTNGTDWFHIPRTLFQESEFNWLELISTALNDSDKVEVQYDTDLLLGLEDGYWTKPYFDCGGGDVWMVTFSMPFFWTDVNAAPATDGGVDGDEGRKLSFVGVTTIDVSLDSLDIQQCDPNDEDQGGVFDPFVGTHRCKNTTECLNIPQRGFERGSYRCECRAGYYYPDVTSEVKAFDGAVIEAEYFKKLQGETNNYDSWFECVSCAEGCEFCLDDRKCLLEIAKPLELVILTAQSFIVLVLFVTGIYIFVKRENRVIKAASPSLLHVLLLGAALLHAEIVLLVEWVHPVPCFVQSCLRHLGFSLVYGALLLKTWRITKVFQVKSAKRVRIPDSALLARLGILLVVTGVYLTIAAFVDFSELKATSQEIEPGYNVKFQSCEDKWWDYAGLAVEMVLLMWGVYLCIRVRRAPSEFNEARFISFTVYNQAIVQIFVPIMELALYDSYGSPNMIAIVGFVRVHITATLMVALIFGSKIVFVNKEADNPDAKTRTDMTKTGISTVDTITVDFAESNPAVQSEIDRIEKYIAKIAEQLRDHAISSNKPELLDGLPVSLGEVSKLKRVNAHRKPKVEGDSTNRESVNTTTTMVSASAESLDKTESAE